MELKPGEKVELRGIRLEVGGIRLEDEGGILPTGPAIVFTMPEKKDTGEPKDSDRLFCDVSREEYLSFLRAYPRRLEFAFTGICEPPLGSYNDFTLAPKWPDSIVAKESRDWLGPDGEEDFSCPGKYWKYSIRKSLLAGIAKEVL